MRRAWLLVGSLVTVVACAKDAPTAPAPAPRHEPGPPVPAIDFVPKEAGFVMVADWSRLQETPLVTHLYTMQGMSVVDLQMEFDRLCGVYLIDTVKTVVAAAGGTLPDNFGVFLLQGKWEQAKMEECLTRAIAKKHLDDRVRGEGRGDATVFSFATRVPLKAAWYRDVAVLAPAADGGQRFFDIYDRRSSLRDNAAVTSLLDRTDRGAPLYAAWVLQDSDEVKGLLGGLAGGKEKVIGIFASFDLTHALKVRAGVRVAAAADAAVLLRHLQKQLDAAKKNDVAGELLRGATLSTEGVDVIGTLALDEEQTNRLPDLLEELIQRYVGADE